MKRTALLLLILGLSLRAAVANEDSRVMRAYPLYTRDSTAMISMVETVVGSEGRVIYDRPNGRLLVMATEGAQQQVADMMQEFNVPPVNVRIQVEVEESQREQLAGVGASGNVQVDVTEDGTQVSGTVTPHAEHRTTRRGRTTRQQLLLQSGTDAVLHVGEQVPYADWLVQYGLDQGYLVQAVELREVGAVLRVQARVIGDGPLISLKLTPELSGMADDGQKTLQFTRVSTDVTVADGQTVDLGGLTENSEFYQRFLVGVDRAGKNRALIIKATPRIERPAAPPPAPVAVPAPVAEAAAPAESPDPR